MESLERTVEEKASAKRRARHYVEDHRVSKWAAIVQAALLLLVITVISCGIGVYAFSVGERDNDNYKNELGQQPVFETDRSIKAYDQYKARHGLK